MCSGSDLCILETEHLDPLPAVQLPITPSESNPRAIRLVTDLKSYQRLAATIPSAELNAKRKRLRAGDVATVGTIWRKRMRELPLSLVLHL